MLYLLFPVSVIVHHHGHGLIQRGQALVAGNDLVQCVEELHIGLAFHHAVVLTFDVAAAKIGRHLQNIVECLHLAGRQPGGQSIAVDVAQQRRHDLLFRGGILGHQLVDRLGIGLHKVGHLNDIRLLGRGIVAAQRLRHAGSNVHTVIFQIIQNGLGQIRQGGALRAGHRNDPGRVAGGCTLKPTAQSAAVVDNVVHGLEEMRVAAIDHLVVAARRTGHLDHRADHRVYGLHLVGGQLADIWQYIQRENIEIVPLYFAKERPVIYRDGNIIMVDDDRLKLRPGEKIENKKVRFRTLGCYPLTGELASIRKKGLEFAKNTSWEREAEKVKEAILRGIHEDEQKIQK